MATKITENQSWGGQYFTPQTKLLEIVSEGLLCASGEFTIKSFENDDETLNF